MKTTNNILKSVFIGLALVFNITTFAQTSDLSYNQNALNKVLVSHKSVNNDYITFNQSETVQNVESWMSNPEYFQIVNEPVLKVENWMTDLNYFNESEEFEFVIENWMLNAEYFKPREIANIKK